MSYLKKVLRKCLICVLLVLLFASCDLFKTDDPTGPGDDNYNWKYLSTTDYPIESTDDFRINDSISGGIFEFPSGGSGDLTIKRISKAPLIEGDANVFEIQYDKNNKVLFYQKHKEGDIDYFMTYTYDEYVQLNEDTNRTGWYSLPVTREENGYYVYDLDSIFGNANPSGITLLSTKKTIKAISINFPSSTKISKKPTECKKAVEEIVDKLIDVLPTNLQDDAKKKYNAKKFYVTVYNNKFSENSWNFYRLGNSYKPFSPYMGSEIRQLIFLDDADITNIAHETGHLFHHFSIGNSNYKNIIKYAVKVHSPGTRRSRNDISEEPAYLTELFITNGVKGGGYTIQNILFDRTGKIETTNYPLSTDFPSLEGFTALMCYLPISKNKNARKFDDMQIILPEIKSITWTEVFKMIYENTNNVNDFRTKLEGILAKNSEENKFLIYLQAMGWNYRVKCRFVDKDNKPLSDVEARFISVYKPEEYSLNLGIGSNGKNKTGQDGKYQFNESYPGKSKIRVYTNGSQEYIDLGPYEIDWKKPTTEIIDLGDILVPTNGPLITNVTPKTCVTNSQVKLTGINFKEWGELFLNDENIYFNDWKDTEILFKVPSSAKKGINKIYVMVNNVKSNEVELDVQLPVSKLDIEPLVSIINKGASVQLIPKMTDQEGNPVTDRPVTWNSYSTNIITLTDKGLVSGLKEGVATITASTDFANNQCLVCVSDPDPTLKSSAKIDGYDGLAVEYNINGIALSKFQTGVIRKFSGFPNGSTITLTAKVYGPYSIEGSWETNADLYVNSKLVERVRAPDKGGELGWTHTFKTITVTVDEEIKKNGWQVHFGVGYTHSMNSEGVVVQFNSNPCKK